MAGGICLRAAAMTFFFFGKNAFQNQRATMTQNILIDIFLSVAKAVTDETGHKLSSKG
jgi:hypothetical protein